ncbi:MAG: LytTR family transcriptional regulator [Lewinellaceae bacterium]|nr:LytTR family transcriptional regulator [Saprospiraceae bacterium]MCB9344127.1 LytTR family transcriptional regulator [Lewinellaceae bacterium]
MFIQSLKTRLAQPYPLRNSWRVGLISGLTAGAFVSFFLYAFQPFGTKVPKGMEWQYFKVCLLFGLVTLATTLLVTFLTVVFKKTFDEEKWVIWKEILFNLFFIGCIGLGNLLLAHVLWNTPLSLKTIWYWQGATFAVGVFPITVGALMAQVKLSRKYSAEADKIALKPHKPHTEELILEGDNQHEVIRITSDQLAYIEAADNYVRVFYFENQQLRHDMLRATMKKMEDAVSAHKQLFRCHRTYLVNLDLVQKVSGNAQGYRLHLHNVPESIPVSRNLNNDIQQMFL